MARWCNVYIPCALCSEKCGGFSGEDADELHAQAEASAQRHQWVRVPEASKHDAFWLCFACAVELKMQLTNWSPL